MFSARAVMFQPIRQKLIMGMSVEKEPSIKYKYLLSRSTKTQLCNIIAIA